MPSFLLVEDDPGTLQLFTTIIQREYPNSRIAKATNIDRALEFMTRDRPDMILLDLALPGRNGLDFLDKINASPELQFAKIIVITAHNDLSRQAQKKGVAVVLIKPVRPRDLVETVKKVL